MGRRGNGTIERLNDRTKEKKKVFFTKESVRNDF